MKQLLQCAVLALVLAVAGCAGMSQEAKLQQGYKTAEATVKGTHILVDRDAISVKDAQSVETVNRVAKDTLDAGAEKLRECRALEAANAPGTKSKCEGATANISFGSSMLMTIENYLKAMGLKQE
jgi:hypothetical protein